MLNPWEAYVVACTALMAFTAIMCTVNTALLVFSIKLQGAHASSWEDYMQRIYKPSPGTTRSLWPHKNMPT